MGDQPVARPLPAHGTAQTQNKRTKTSMPQVGYEPTIPVFACLRPRGHRDRLINLPTGLKRIECPIGNCSGMIDYYVV
jgi:hypothetical protein